MSKQGYITEQQIEAIDMMAKQIKTLPGGRFINVFRSLTGTVRLQDDRTEETRKYTRMFCVCKDDSVSKIMDMMMDAYEKICEDIKG